MLCVSSPRITQSAMRLKASKIMLSRYSHIPIWSPWCNTICSDTDSVSAAMWTTQNKLHNLLFIICLYSRLLLQKIARRW